MSPDQNSNRMPLVRPSSGGELWYLIFMTVLLVILFLVLCCIVTPPIAMFVTGIVLLILARRSEIRRRVNCWTLSIALEKRIPLSRTIASLAAESGMVMRSRLWQLFCYVESGVRFEDAICGVPKVIPRFALPLFRIGCLSGKPSRAMQIICSQQDTENHKIAQTLLGRLFYITICFLVTGVILPFMAIKIVPAFCKIAEDFDSADSISIFSRLMSITGNPLFSLVIVFLACILLALVVVCFYVLLRLMGVVTFDLPLARSFMIKFHRSRIQESLSLAAECDMPIGDAIRELAMFYPTGSVRSRLVRVFERVDSGLDWKTELRKVGLLSGAEYAVIENAEATGDLAWTLRLLADRGRRHMLYWAQWLQQILFVGLVLVFASVVFVTALATFEFLSRLISELS